MKVLLLAPPHPETMIRDLYCSFSSKANYYWPPIDLLVLSGLLRDSCDLAVIDGVAERLDPRACLDRIAAARPDVLISLVGSASWRSDTALLKAAVETTGCRVLVTGDVAMDAELWILKAHDFIDGAIRDFTSPDIPAVVAGGEGPSEAVALRRGGTPAPPAPWSRQKRAMSFGVPRHDLFPLSRYRLPYVWRYPMASVLTNFGCPFGCTFCIQSRWVVPHRLREPANFALELDELGRLGVRELYFRDPLFESNKENALAVCRLLEGRGFTWSCNSRVDTLNAELLSAMRKAGCRLVSFGIETGDEAMARSVGKAITRRQVLDAVALCRREGVKTAGYFILGLPGETRETARKTIDFAVACGVDYASFSVPAPDYGTPLREEALKKNLTSGVPRDYDSSRKVVLKTESLAEAEVKELQREAYLAFYARPSFLAKQLLGLRSARQLADVAASGLNVFKSFLQPSA